MTRQPFGGTAHVLVTGGVPTPPAGAVRCRPPLTVQPKHGHGSYRETIREPGPVPVTRWETSTAFRYEEINHPGPNYLRWREMSLLMSGYDPMIQTRRVYDAPQPGDGTHNAKQLVTLRNVTGGTFQLTFNGQATAPIAWDAPAATVQAALVALSNIGEDTSHEPNVGVTQSANTYTVEFLHDRGLQAQALMTSAIVVTTTVAGNGSQNAIQHVAVGSSVSSGTFTLDFTYDVRPLGLAADANHVGTLSAGPYFYVVTAVTAAGESLPSGETFKVVGAHGAIQVDWGDVPGALSYNVYRGTASGAENTRFSTASTSFLDDGTASGSAGRRRGAGPKITCAPCLGSYSELWQTHLNTSLSLPAAFTHAVIGQPVWTQIAE